MRRYWTSAPILAMAALIVAVYVARTPVLAQEEEDIELGPVFLLSLGGTLYDDVWAVLAEEPPQPRNPKVGPDLPIDDRASWRCVTCHGWDYAGARIGNIRYPELRSLEGMDQDWIAERIRDPAHPYPGDQLPEMAVTLLAAFISLGQYDFSSFIDAAGLATGESEIGRDIFEGACTNCHQLDGRRFLRGEPGDRSSLGWIARNRPAQALHKILNGVPATEMLALRFLTPQQIADLVAYLQTLDPDEQ